jgi:hypothetical protein
VTDAAYLYADAADAHAALTAATAIVTGSVLPPHDLPRLADIAYRWLRSRDSLLPVSVQIIPGIPYPEEGAPMTMSFTLDDTDEVVFSLTGQDAKGAAVALPAGSAAAWTLDDPAASGAVLTDNADGTATLAAGVPDANLMVNVTVTITNADGSTSTLQGAEAVIVQATAATTVGIVAGTPSAEPPSAAPAG